MKLIIGLGNPGRQYEHTRHNIGFYVLDQFLQNENWLDKFNGKYIKKNVDDQSVIFLKPQTFMNLSGDSIVKFVKYFKIKVEDILIIHDDLDLNFKTYRLKRNSSSGGHNGIKSVIQNLNNDSFVRLKIGISNEFKTDIVDFVLGKFTTEEQKFIDDHLTLYFEIIESFIKNGVDNTFLKFNHK